MIWWRQKVEAAHVRGWILCVQVKNAFAEQKLKEQQQQVEDEARRERDRLDDLRKREQDRILEVKVLSPAFLSAGPLIAAGPTVLGFKRVAMHIVSLFNTPCISMLSPLSAHTDM